MDAMIRRLYDWTLGLAAHRHAMGALAIVAVLESSAFPISPDLLMIPTTLARPDHAFVISAPYTAARSGEFSAAYNHWGARAVLIAGVTPPVQGHHHPSGLDRAVGAGLRRRLGGFLALRWI